VDTANTDYAALPFVFGDRLQPSDVLVDIGCGKGRVINWWLSRELGNRIVGVEVNKAVAQMTQRRLKRHKNVKIVCGDALKNLPEDGTIFYLFNPFDRPWVAALKDRLAILFGSGERRTIFYYNCVHADVFKEGPDWIVEEVVPEPPSRFHPVAIIRKRNRNPEPGPGHDDSRGC
jgi:SAM-dependent methyltransferase